MCLSLLYISISLKGSFYTCIYWCGNDCITHQMNSRQWEQKVGCLRKVAMNLCPLTWCTRRRMAPRRLAKPAPSLNSRPRLAPAPARTASAPAANTQALAPPLASPSRALIHSTHLEGSTLDQLSGAVCPEVPDPPVDRDNTVTWLPYTVTSRKHIANTCSEANLTL